MFGWIAGCGLWLPCGEVKVHAGIILMYCMGRRDASRSRGGGVGYKFHHRETVCSVILFPADVSSQIIPEVLRSFRLAVCLRMVGGGKLALDTKGCGEILPEQGNELRATVRYNSLWEPVESDYAIKEEPSLVCTPGHAGPRIFRGRAKDPNPAPPRRAERGTKSTERGAAGHPFGPPGHFSARCTVFF